MPNTWFPQRGISRRVLNVALAALLAFATLIVIPSATEPAHGQTADTTIDSCNVDVLFILDESGSMQGTGESEVRAGVKGFIDSLAATDSRIGFVEFNTTARIPLGSTWYNTDTPGDVTTMKAYLDGGGSPEYDAGGWTNWEDALIKAGDFVSVAGAPDFVVLITDGQPTTFGDGSSTANDATQWEAGTVAAEDDYAALASVSGEIIGFGAGSDFASGDPRDRLDRVTDTVTSVSPLSNLSNVIIAYADQVCSPVLDVEKETNGQQADSPPGPSIAAGDTVTWTYTVTNDGPVTLYDVLVTDDDNQGATITCPAPGNGNLVLNPGDEVECSASSFSYFTERHRQHANTATATGSSERQGDASDEDDSHYRPILVCPFDAGDGIVVDFFAEDSLGGFLNKSSRGSFSVSESIPAGTYSVHWASYDAHAWKNEPNPGQTAETWNVTIAGATSSVTTDLPWNQDTIEGTLGEPLTVPTAASSVSVNLVAPAGVSNSVHAVCIALEPLEASIDVDKSTNDSPVSEGEAVSFTIVVTNDGEVPLTNVSVDDPETPACDFAAGDTATSPAGEFDGTLDVGASVTYTCTTEPLESGFTNTATATGTPPVGEPVDDVDDEPVEVEDIPASISLVKEADEASVTEPGGDATFTLTVENTSPVDDVTITGLTDTVFADVASVCTPTFIGSTLAPGGTASCTFTKFIDGPHTNTATVTATSDDGDELDATDDETIRFVDTPASIEVTKTVENGDVNLQAPGENVTYEVVIENTSVYDEVTIDTLVDSVDGGPDFDITSPATDPVIDTTCVLPVDIDAGDSYDCTFTVFVGGDVGAEVTDTVTASGTSEDDEPVEDDGSVTVFLDSEWRVVLYKQVCDSYDEIRANENPTNKQESAYPLGAEIDGGALPVNTSWESANHDCAPVEGWPFTFGYSNLSPGSSDFTGLADTLSHVGDPEATVSTNADGQAILELTDEQLIELIIDQGRIWIMEGEYEGQEMTFPDDPDADFGIIRCATDALNGDNVEFLTAADFANGDYTATCYAYNVVEDPDLEIDKEATAIDGETFVDGDVAKVGQTIDYEITVTNTGNIPLTGVTVTDEDIVEPLVCTWPGAEGELAVGDGAPDTLGDGDTVVCTGFHVVTSQDAVEGSFLNTAVADANEIDEPRDDDEEVPTDFVYKVTFVKRVCDAYGDVRANLSNPGSIIEHADPLGASITWPVVDPALEEAAHGDCAPLAGWNFSLGQGFVSGGSPESLSYVTGAYDQEIVTLESTPLLDSFGNPIGDELLEGAVTIELTDEQAERAFRDGRDLWVSEGTADDDGAVIPEGYGFGIVRCGIDNRHGDNAEWIEFHDLANQQLTEDGPTNVAHVFCYAYNVALDPSIDVTKTVDTPEVVVSGTVEFTITVLNDGNVTLEDLVLEDILEFGTDQTEQLPQCETPEVTTLAPGASTVVTCTQELDAVNYGTGVLNTVKATATATTGGEVSDEDEVPVTIVPPESAMGIVKAVGPLGTPVDGDGFDDTSYSRAAGETGVTWRITLTNLSDYRIVDVALSDEATPACETAFADAVQVDDDGTFMDPNEVLAFVCDDPDVATAKVNVARATGFDLWGGALDPVEDSAFTDTVAASASIGDTVWSDDNENGVQDDGEKGIAGATVRLTLPDDTTADATTNANGLYLFSALPAGTYTVELILGSIPDPDEGDLELTTAGSFSVTLEDGQSFLDADFGVAASLPKTGISTDRIALIALALLLAGGLAVLVTHRRRDDGPDEIAA